MVKGAQSGFGAMASFPEPVAGLRLNGSTGRIYELLERLTEGQFSSVWRAVDEQSGASHAIQVFLPGEDAAEFYERELSGMSEIERLQCPRCLKVTEVFEYQGLHCMVLRLDEDGSILQPMSVPLLLTVESTACAHSRSCVRFGHAQAVAVVRPRGRAEVGSAAGEGAQLAGRGGDRTTHRA